MKRFRRGSFLRRQILLVLATILVTSLLISLTYGFYIQQVFVDQKAGEFLANAQTIWAFYADWENGEISYTYYRSAVQRSMRQWEAHGAIYDAQGKLQASSAEMTIASQPGAASSSVEYPVIPLVEPYLNTVLSGQDIVSMGHSFSFRGDMIVGKAMRDENGDVVGAVFLTRKMSELTAALGSFNSALRVTIMAVIFIMLLPTFAFARLMSRPIFHMCTVALRMARGDFSARANEAAPGEIGELGMSLNYLATELSSTISALELEKSRLASIVDGLGEGILAVDAAGHITHLNPALLAMFGHSAATDDRQELIPDPGLWEDFDRALEEKKPLVRQLSLGSSVLRVSISPLEGEDAGIAGAVGLFRDVTESERLEQTRRDYVANVSHELRTPISSVRGLAEALKDGLVKDEEGRQRYYGFILREVMRLTRLIEDLLELSRLQSGATALRTQRVNVADLAQDFAERYRRTAEDVGIDFVLDMPQDCPPALTNPDRVDQVLVILLDNAIKFTPEGGSVGLRVRWDEERVHIGVPDTGTGIAPEDLPHVFERFYKADKAHTGQGTGLGLSIAWEIVQQLGGTLTVQSEQGKGSCFEVSVPRYTMNNCDCSSPGKTKSPA